MTESVPFLDLRPAYLELRRELDEAYRRVLESGWYILGEELERFEQEFARFLGARHVVAVASGLDALTLPLRALGLEPGDEVLVPSHTFIATWLAVLEAGALPVPVEPDPGTMNLDVGGLEERIGPRTRAIVPVHLYGQPVRLDAVRAVAERHGLAIVEDAAQAHGARFQGRRIGAGFGSLAVSFSFYPAKNLGAYGDGGAVATEDDAFADRLRALRNYGSRVKYHHETRGVNSRLDPLQAALLRVKLGRLEEWNDRRRAVAERYLEGLVDVPGLHLPAVHPEADPVWHLFVVRHACRDQLQSHLAARGIATGIHYPIPPHRSAALATLDGPRSLPIAEGLAREVLSLPIGPHLPGHQVNLVIGALRDFCSKTKTGDP